MSPNQIDLAAYIRDIPDFPKPGIVFKDITPLVQDPKAFSSAIDRIADEFASRNVDIVACIDARGFVFGGALAYRMGKSLVLLRKPGKLPYRTISVEYELEYGKNALAIHEDALSAGKRVLLVDDVIATGGTIRAAADLIERLGGTVVAIAALIELSFLEPRCVIGTHEVYSLLSY
ncbi:adenine phosphoribosyltransferase [Candidatus Poribacteria bacterium]|nr:adenine phosphoribosyltransferase [Candidatus Poribacteria bacterium]